MSEHIPSLKGEISEFNQGYRLYELDGGSNMFIRVRSISEFVDIMLDDDKALASAIGVPKPHALNTEERRHVMMRLISIHEQELKALESYGVVTPSHQAWIGEVEGEESVVIAASKVSGKSIAVARNEDTNELDFDRLPSTVWRNFGQMLSGILRYYEDTFDQGKFFIHDLTDPKQWVYDEYDKRVYLTDLDPTISYLKKQETNDYMASETAKLHEQVKQLVGVGYMPPNAESRARELIIEANRL